MTGSTEGLDNRPSKAFRCGVVEGFYGIPWTTEQRKLLFEWMNRMGMNTYMYAPKDDAKHRAFWRDLYSVEEAENLTSLIEAASNNNVQLVYAISPGLDISFSSAKDVQFLKRKLEQVAAFGCKAFALLFDDIDPELSASDKGAFQSSACAQVSVTNEVYEHLGQPEFYFCPTEYCTSRAMPTLSSSGYLNTVGSKLLNDIHVLWTGSRVISKKITISELEEISRVLRRPPVIWDNIHANDYDPRRVYLGPYDGRSPEIIPYIRGVLTNPNCEFEANYIPLHTLGQWARSNTDRVKKDIITESRLSPVVSDIKLETEDEYVSDEDLSTFDTRYQPKHALKKAITDWLEEFRLNRLPPRTVAIPIPGPKVPVPDVLPSCDNLETTVIPQTTTSENPSYLQPTSTVLANSLVDPIVTEKKDSDSDSDSDISVDSEPMECAPTDNSTAVSHENGLKGQNSDDSMQVEHEVCECPKQESETKPHTDSDSIQKTDISMCLYYDDVDLLVNMFYLPFDYGSRPLHLLHELHWLRCNAHLVSNKDKKMAEEWNERAEKFHEGVSRVQHLASTFKEIPNQSIHYYFYPYLWDILGVLQTCSTFVRWLGLGHVSLQNSSMPTPVPPYTCDYSAPTIELETMSQRFAEKSNFTVADLSFATTSRTHVIKGLFVGADPEIGGGISKEYRDSFTNGDLEPWCFQGGLQAEFQIRTSVSQLCQKYVKRQQIQLITERLLPIPGAHDLFHIRHPERMIRKNYTYRPYKPSDETAMYDICLKTCDDGMDGTEVFPEYPDIIGDRILGGYLTLSQEMCFVVEDEFGVMGYVVAALDAKSFHQKQKISWFPAMCEKYPKPAKLEELTPAEEVMQGFHTDTDNTPDSIYTSFPSIIRLDILPGRMEDLALSKRLLAVCLSSLKTNGSKGVHVELNIGDKYMMEHYRLLGFIQVPNTGSDDTIYFGRLL